MKITFYSDDPGNHRFIEPIIEKLKQKGYECELLVNWQPTTSEIYFFDFCDNNLISASQENFADLKQKRVIARLHSVEAYLGFYKSINWECVDDLIFVSEHIKRKCSDVNYPASLKISVIPNGIPLDKWTFRERNFDASHTLNGNFGYVGNIIPQKGLLTFLHYFSSLKLVRPEIKFYLAGLSRLNGREGEYWEYQKNKIGNIYEEGEISDPNKWLEEKHITWFIQPSYAESFSMVIGEAMACGIKPVINDFWGSRELWPQDLIYSNFPEFLKIIESPYESLRYREFVKKHYSLDDVVNSYEQLLGYYRQ